MTASVAFSSFPPKLVVLSVLGLLTQKQKCCHAAFHLVLSDGSPSRRGLHGFEHAVLVRRFLTDNGYGSLAVGAKYQTGFRIETHNQRTKESEVAVSYGLSPCQAISFAVLTPLYARPAT